jgi:uncharacterized OB-fold protein
MAVKNAANSARQEGRRMVPLVEGLFQLPSAAGEKGHLIGRKCRQCGTYFFPNTGSQKIVCLNCFGRDLEEVALSRRGTLYSYCICHAVADFVVVKAPFAIGTILLPKENILVWTTSASDCDLGSLRLDMEVELVFEKVKEDAAGNAVITFQFRPLQPDGKTIRKGGR